MLTKRLISPRPILGYAFGLFLLGASAECRAQSDADSLPKLIRISLDSAIALAEKNYPVIAASRAQLAAYEARAKVDTRALAWQPATIMAGPWMAPYNPAEGRRMNQQGMVMLSAVQMFPRKGEAEAMTAERKAEATMAKAEAQRTLASVRSEVRTAYFNVMFAEARLKLIDSQLNSALEISKRLQNQFQGNANLVSLLQAQKAVEEFELKRKLVASQYYTGMIQLGQLIGVDQLRNEATIIVPQILLSDKEIDKLFLFYKTPENLLTSNILQTQAKSLTLSAAQNIVSLNYKPMWGARIDHMQGLGSMPNLFTAGVMLQLPLTGKKGRLNDQVTYLAQQRAMVDEAFAEFSQIELLKTGVIQDDAAAKTEETLLTEKLIPLQRQIIQALENAQRANKATALEVLEAQMALFDYQMRLLDAQERWAMAAIELLSIYEL